MVLLDQCSSTVVLGEHCPACHLNQVRRRETSKDISLRTRVEKHCIKPLTLTDQKKINNEWQERQLKDPCPGEPSLTWLRDNEGWDRTSNTRKHQLTDTAVNEVKYKHFAVCCFGFIMLS